MPQPNISFVSFESYAEGSKPNINALVFTDALGRNFYFSYKTLIAVSGIPGGKIVHANDWGTTTGKHLNLIDGGSKDAKAQRLDADAFQEVVNNLL